MYGNRLPVYMQVPVHKFTSIYTGVFCAQITGTSYEYTVIEAYPSTVGTKYVYSTVKNISNKTINHSSFVNIKCFQIPIL